MPTPAAYFLGIDVARSGLALVIMAGDGTQAASLRRAYSASTDGRHDPQDWWRAARTGIKEILRRASLRADQIRCIGLTGDSDGLVALSKDGKVLCPSILGPDPQAAAQVELLNKTVGARNLLNLASGPAHTGATAVKLLWLRENEKRVWHDLGAALAPKDFLRFRLCETLVTDASDAAATLLFNPKTRAWSKQLLGLLGIDPAWMPAVNSGQIISGRVTATAAREAGLQAGTPVITGGGHAASTAICAGVLGAGQVMVELGDGGGLFAPATDAGRDPAGRLQSTCHCVAGIWASAAPDLAGRDAIDWLMEHLFASESMQARRAQRDPLEALGEQAAETPPGADGLLYLAPSQLQRGSGFIGLERRHGRGHLVRAVLEGGALAARQAVGSLTELKRPPTEVIAVGPGAANNLWCQILADALDHPIHAITTPEAAASGAAMLACSAVGIYKSIHDTCQRLVKHKLTYQPRKAAAEVYHAMLPAYTRLPQALASAFQPALAAEAKP